MLVKRSQKYFLTTNILDLVSCYTKQSTNSVVLRKRMKEAFKIQRAEIADLNADLEDSLLGVRVVKSFANEEKEKDHFAKGNGKF